MSDVTLIGLMIGLVTLFSGIMLLAFRAFLRHDQSTNERRFEIMESAWHSRLEAVEKASNQQLTALEKAWDQRCAAMEKVNEQRLAAADKSIADFNMGFNELKARLPVDYLMKSDFADFRDEMLRSITVLDRKLDTLKER